MVFSRAMYLTQGLLLTVFFGKVDNPWQWIAMFFAAIVAITGGFFCKKSIR